MMIMMIVFGMITEIMLVQLRIAHMVRYLFS